MKDIASDKKICSVNFFISFMWPILEYGDVLWYNCAHTEIRYFLESLQIEGGKH